MEKLEDLKEFLMERKYLIIVGGVLVLLIVFGIYFFFDKHDNEEEVVLDSLVIEEELVDESEILEECFVKVDIKGEVVNPGLYEMKCNSRVNDVINLAGGITNKGDTSILNLGKIVTDEMVIVVYSKDEVSNFEEIKEKEEKQVEECIKKTEIKNDACLEVPVSSTITNDDIVSNTNDEEVIGDTPVKVLVSLNNATKQELMTLSGIGESKANNIITYRNENGGFKTLEEIKNVKGIGDSIFEKIKDDITL